jgi:hypothetical protein
VRLDDSAVKGACGPMIGRLPTSDTRGEGGGGCRDMGRGNLTDAANDRRSHATYTKGDWRKKEVVAARWAS